MIANRYLATVASLPLWKGLRLQTGLHKCYLSPICTYQIAKQVDAAPSAPPHCLYTTRQCKGSASQDTQLRSSAVADTPACELAAQAAGSMSGGLHGHQGHGELRWCLPARRRFGAAAEGAAGLASLLRTGRADVLSGVSAARLAFAPPRPADTLRTAQVVKQCSLPETAAVAFADVLFQPVPWSPATRKGMPQEFERYHGSPEFAIINVPPNFMFQAKIFKPSRLCAVYHVTQARSTV